MVARLEVSDVLAHCLDDAGRFMTQHDGHRRGVRPLDEVQVAVAQAGRSGSNQHLAALGLVDRDVLDGHRLAGGVKNCSFHGGFQVWD